MQQNYWDDPAIHRNFFDELAKDMDFDPLVAENWYKMTHNTVIKKKVWRISTNTRNNIYWQGGTSIIKHYEGSYIKALEKLYPEVSFSRDMFHKGISLVPEFARS